MTATSFYNIEQKLVARMTVEAYTQSPVLSNQDLALLLNQSPAHVRRLLDDYQQAHGVLLPTTGTILDMGSTLTHKKMAVELYLQGNNTTQISRRLFHTPQVIDNYLSAFNKIAMLHLLLKSNVRLTSMITSLSETLVQEHMSLINQCLPEDSYPVQYLAKEGIEIPSSSFGT